MELHDEDYVVLRDYIQEICGLYITTDKKYLMVQRLAPVVAEYGCADFSDLAALVAQGPDASLRESIIDEITNSETYFFRDGHPFEAFARTILPDLHARMSRGRCACDYKASVWSAGSSTGQEPYSLAMLTREYANDVGSGPGSSVSDFHILATDVSRKSLTRAGRGAYTPQEISRGLPQAKLTAYFTRNGREWLIQPELKEAVEFRKHNLIHSSRGLGPFDVIFCRNVLIYFDMETKKKVLAEFRKLLPEHGYLILGSSESLYGLKSGFESERIGDTIVYRRA